MKLKNQIFVILGLILAFVLFDLSIFNVVTKRYIDPRGDEMKSRSIEVSEYLPFTEDSGIVHVDSSVKLSGDLPVIDGAAALYPMFSAFVDATYPKESVSFDGTDFTEDSALQFHNTRGAYQAVVDGDADIIFCAKPSEEQLAYAEEKGVELKMVPIGYEAFVFIVGKDNPVDDLTIEQVQGLYTGKYKNWSEVGGDNRLVDAVQRNTGSGSQTAMLSFMNGQEMKKSVMGALTGRAIGFSFRYYVEGLSVNPDVKMLSLNGVYPSEENIANGTYPIASNFYAVYDASNENENISLLLDFILSDVGQRIVKESGYTPMQ
ncbi:phosphate transport system substrate-binding protein [Butyrivibrio hungatei DSM 14810]|uniref:Phosphate transport system substrate-binding protein n=1 Tax=Butyrivibrio hungatei DSM 14810 TaxID=1121132 RepID=A0A1M7SES4_9FIRM|nr:substrate-binding domain-containing protein [Butyrivibrio hungatei]SHN56985.1 phosphate transport system substrate-binding protein [Butyrivibrio hungatei DSM 14810]